MSIPPPPGAPQPPEPQGPYGPYAPHPPYQAPPYQAWGQGYSPYARPAPVNGVAIAALVLGILCCIPVVGLVLGLIALRQINRKGERGRSMAITGSVLSSFGLVLWVVVIATGGVSGIWEGVKEGAREGSLTQGECFDSPSGMEGSSYDLDEVPCAGEHDGEVFAVVKLPGGSFPGDASVTRTAEDKCYTLQYAYAMDAWALPGDVDVYYIVPSAESWRLGDREITCSFGNTDANASLGGGSLRNDETTLDADQVAYLKAVDAQNTALDSAPEDTPDDDLAANKQWAARVSAALAKEAGMLSGHPWPADAKQPVAVVVKELEALQKPWSQAAGADDVDTFYTHYDEALRLEDPTKSVTARKALGLATNPPSYDDGGSGEAGGGGGGGSSRLDV
ncbi:DUF4190 domain-containing protein [Streptomyces sp. NPDC050619]|uniref:DUF4190 domain-containing protein n=1 Tax=Streptomyces sp. NPDC050619 TaxID=3157214 RepID=UPI0034208866